jgi:hypothetical protein
MHASRRPGAGATCGKAHPDARRGVTRAPPGAPPSQNPTPSHKVQDTMDHNATNAFIALAAPGESALVDDATFRAPLDMPEGTALTAGLDPEDLALVFVEIERPARAGSPAGSRRALPARSEWIDLRPAEARRLSDHLRALSEAAARWVLAAVHNIQPDVPPENVLAFVEAGRSCVYG